MIGLEPRRPAPAPDAHRLLIRAIGERLPFAAILSTQSTLWASATFSGARHRIELVLPCAEQAAAFAGEAAELELPIRGHVVADLTAQLASGGRLILEALTIEDA